MEVGRSMMVGLGLFFRRHAGRAFSLEIRKRSRPDGGHREQVRKSLLRTS